MGREVRRVPADWNHPRDKDGHYVPLYGDSISEAKERWDEENLMWCLGYKLALKLDERLFMKRDKTDAKYEPYSEWDGERPKAEYYRPDWKPEEMTHWQMYETVTEGTPISPVCATPEELAKWLSENDSYGSNEASYDQWMSVIKRGSAPSFMVDSKGVTPGFAAD